MEFLGKADGVTAIAIAGYLGAVIYQDNIKELLKLLSGEMSYLELLIALSALGFLMSNKDIGPIIKPLVGIAVLGVIIRAASHTNLSQVTADFASGKTGIFGTVAAIFGGTTK